MPPILLSIATRIVCAFEQTSLNKGHVISFVEDVLLTVIYQIS